MYRASIEPTSRQLLSPGEVHITTTAQLVSAFACPLVVLAWITVPALDFTDADWRAYDKPILLTRNFTVRGNADVDHWPILRLNYVKAKVRLASGVRLTFQDVVLARARADSPTRVPGIDLLAPTLTGGMGELALGPGLIILEACLPPEAQRANIKASIRPAEYSGQQAVTLHVPQDGCVNDTAAAPMKRCWPSRAELPDMVFSGASPGLAGQPMPNNVVFVLHGATTVCETMVDQACVDQYGLLTCLVGAVQEAVNRFNGGLLPPVPAAVGSRQGGGGAADDGSSGSRVPVVCGAVAGAVALVFLLVPAAVWAWRRQRAAPSKRYSAAAAVSHPSSGKSPDVKEAGPPIDSGSGLSGEERLLSLSPEPGGVWLVDTDVPVTLLTPPRANLKLDVPMEEDCTTSSSRCDVQDGGHENGTVIGGGGGSVAGVVTLLPVVLGKGAFGRVMEGLYDGKKVAVKVMAEPQQWETTAYGDLIQSFKQEVEVLGRCQHPNVVRLMAACLTPPRLCLVMELMEVSLDGLLYGNPEQPLLPLEKVLHIGTSISRALSYLHPTIVHRDLKPGNVLVNDPWAKRPVVKLTDFGLSRLRSTVVMTQHPEAGTPAYMAPECFDITNQVISHQTDIYSLGVLMWEMLAGYKPWIGLSSVAIGFAVTYEGRRLPLSGLATSRCPPKLQRILTACWDRDPARRPAAAEVAKELTLVRQSLFSCEYDVLMTTPVATLAAEQVSQQA